MQAGSLTIRFLAQSLALTVLGEPWLDGDCSKHTISMSQEPNGSIKSRIGKQVVKLGESFRSHFTSTLTSLRTKTTKKMAGLWSAISSTRLTLKITFSVAHPRLTWNLSTTRLNGSAKDTSTEGNGGTPSSPST